MMGTTLAKVIPQMQRWSQHLSIAASPIGPVYRRPPNAPARLQVQGLQRPAKNGRVTPQIKGASFKPGAHAAIEAGHRPHLKEKRNITAWERKQLGPCSGRRHQNAVLAAAGTTSAASLPRGLRRLCSEILDSRLVSRQLKSA